MFRCEICGFEAKTPREACQRSCQLGASCKNDRPCRSLYHQKHGNLLPEQDVVLYGIHAEKLNVETGDALEYQVPLFEY